MSTLAMVFDGNRCFHRSRSPLLLPLLVLLLGAATTTAAVSTASRQTMAQSRHNRVKNNQLFKDKPGFDGSAVVSVALVAVAVTDSGAGSVLSDDSTTATGGVSFGLSHVDPPSKGSDPTNS